MSEKITIAGHSSHIELIVHGYENVDALNVSDANWLACSLILAVGPFTGELKIALTVRNLEIFNDQLRRVNQGIDSVAELNTDEEAIQCTIMMTTLGHALISGNVQIYNGIKAKLSFSFESDQSFLRQTGTELEIILEKFPVKS